MICPVPKPVKTQKKRVRYVRPKKAGHRALLKDTLGALWARAVVRRDGYRCRAILPDGSRCKAVGLEPHHIIRRSYLNTRFLQENGLTLCAHHHREDLEGLREMVIRTIGREEYDRLKGIALSADRLYEWDMEKMIGEYRAMEKCDGKGNE